MKKQAAVKMSEHTHAMAKALAKRLGMSITDVLEASIQLAAEQVATKGELVMRYTLSDQATRAGELRKVAEGKHPYGSP